MTQPVNSRTISGIVRRADGSPSAGARIYFTRGPVALPDIAAVTGADGGFVVTVPVVGAYGIGCATDQSEQRETTVYVTDDGPVHVEFDL